MQNPAKSERKFLVKRTCPQNKIPASPAKFLEPGAVLRTCTTQRIPLKCGKKIKQKTYADMIRYAYLCKFSATEPLSSSRQTKCPSQTKPRSRLHRWKKNHWQTAIFVISWLHSSQWTPSFHGCMVCLCQGESPSCIISIEWNCLRPWLHAQYHSFELGSLITISCQAGSNSAKKRQDRSY